MQTFSIILYESNQTGTYYEGGRLQTVRRSLKGDTSFRFEVQNGKDNNCMMRIFNEMYENGKLELLHQSIVIRLVFHSC